MIQIGWNYRHSGRTFPKSRAHPALRILLVLMVAAALVAPSAAWAKKKKNKDQGPPADLAGHVEYLAQKLYGLHLDESDALTGEIQRLVLDHMQEWLGQHPPSDKPASVPYHVNVRRELEDVFSKLRYPIYAWPKTFAQPWNGRLMIGVGYTIGWSKVDRANVVALYEREQEITRLAGVTHFVPRTDLNYEFLPSPGSEDFRVLVYGTRLGKSHPRLSAELYSSDGQALKSLWKTEDLYDGQMEVAKDQVVIRYMKESEFIEAATYDRTPPRYEAIYRVSPQGLEIVSDHPIAAQGQ